MNTYVKEYTSFMTDIRHKSLNTVESYNNIFLILTEQA